MHLPTRGRTRPRVTRTWVLTLLAAAALAFPAVALAGGFTAHLYAPTHQPRANTKWRITITAVRGRQQLSGTVSYRFLFNGTQVGTGKGGSFTHGVYHDAIIWPSRAVGHLLSFQAVVKTRYGTDILPWWIKVRR